MEGIKLDGMLNQVANLTTPDIIIDKVKRKSYFLIKGAIAVEKMCSMKKEAL